MKKTMVFLCTLFLTFLSGNASAGPGCKDLSGETGTFHNEIIWSGGLKRSYMLFVPSKYKHSRPTPLVFDFHGKGGGAGGHSNYTQMKALAEKYKFILVTPNAYEDFWIAGPTAPAGIDDVGFVIDLIDRIREKYCINPKRIFATGFSSGGVFSNRLALELSDRIAAVAPVAAFYWPILFEPSRPVPIIVFHGTSDRVVPYLWGLSTVNHWIEHNGCTDETELFFQEGDVTCVAYKGCDEKATVVFCTIDGGGHNWPGAIDVCDPADPVCYFGYTTQDIDASRAIWKFFAEHSMPE